MHNVYKVTDDTWWIGANDRRIAKFENTYPLVNGISYNSYIIMDEKTCLLDGVDSAVTNAFIENLDHVLGTRTLDYMVVQHMEPDHCASIPLIIRRHPDIKLVGSAKTKELIGQFFSFSVDDRFIVIKEGDTLCLGEHTLQFIAAPMVHWPEVMVSYDQRTKTLFSADAFGSFGALGGNLFADEVNWDRDWEDEARSYYANIVGKYGVQTNMLLKKASKLDISMICPLHGHVWREGLGHLLELYTKWATYAPEVDNSVCIYYGSIYGDTANAAEILATKLAQGGARDVRVYDTSKTPTAELVSQAFRCSHLVFASATYNLGIFDSMRELIEDLGAHNVCNRTVGIIYNGSWAPVAGQLMTEKLGAFKDLTILEPKVHITSSVDEECLEHIEELAAAILDSMK